MTEGTTRTWFRPAGDARRGQGAGPLVAQPGRTPGEIREAVAAIDTGALAAFDEDLAATLAAAQENGVRLLMECWWLWVAVERLPGLAARLRDCERRCKTAATLEESRAASAGIGAILEEAAQAAGG